MQLVPNDARPGEIVVKTTTPGSGYGPANITWTSPESGLVTLSGTVWPASGAQVADHTWTLYEGSRALSTGTILAQEFSHTGPFQIALGSGGPGALRNITFSKGEVLKLMLTSSQSDQVGVDLSVSLNPSGIPQYVVGNIPSQMASNGQPIAFIVNPPVGKNGPVSIQVSPRPIGATTFDQATNKFVYVPDKNDKFDFTVQFRPATEERGMLRLRS
jgi:hypothetical protein